MSLARQRIGWWGGLLGVVFVAGCSGSAGPWVELGTGEARFEHVADGQTVDLVHGNQGAWHLWVSLRAQGIEPESVQMELVGEPQGVDAEPSMTEIPINMSPVDGDEGTYERLGWPALQHNPQCLIGHELLLRVTLTDTEETTVSDERLVVVGAGDDPPTAECKE